MKHILITGANSYIGNSMKAWLDQQPDVYTTSIRDTIGWNPVPADFEGYDTVFNVAGIAHIRETAENRHLYFDVNRDLVIRIAEAAREGGIRQFVLLSSMSVYGLTVGHITRETEARPNTAYGESKLQADMAIKKLENEDFVFTCLRPPMVYGKGCKGNYQSLRSFALKFPVFPRYENERSMIYIGNLCDFVQRCIDERRSGLFFPQNPEYTNTSQMAEMIARENGRKIRMTRVFNGLIRLGRPAVVQKVFGNLTYEPTDIADRYGFEESIRLTEGH